MLTGRCPHCNYNNQGVVEPDFRAKHVRVSCFVCGFTHSFFGFDGKNVPLPRAMPEMPKGGRGVPQRFR